MFSCLSTSNPVSLATSIWKVFQTLFPKPLGLPGMVMTQMQNLAFGLLEPHTTDLSLILAVQTPLAEGSFANVLRAHSIPSSRPSMKILNRTGLTLSPRECHWRPSAKCSLMPFLLHLHLESICRAYTHLLLLLY